MSPSENVVEIIMRSKNFCYFFYFCGTLKKICAICGICVTLDQDRRHFFYFLSFCGTF